MSRHICDGHEYRVIWDVKETQAKLLNNYGTHVATLTLLWPAQEHWSAETVEGQEELFHRHENDVIDNLLDQEFVQAYVAWAVDNETVEDH